ncbi:unnamed protein product [Cochlearia groenlandica]
MSFSRRTLRKYNLVAQTKQMGRLPVLQYASGEIADAGGCGDDDAARLRRCGRGRRGFLMFWLRCVMGLLNDTFRI